VYEVSRDDSFSQYLGISDEVESSYQYLSSWVLAGFYCEWYHNRISNHNFI